ncbi:MAG: MaoC family dehydratase [Bacteroidales bacterium]|nr:MaoC family dehydratase [Bacteroidales bacterium]
MQKNKAFHYGRFLEDFELGDNYAHALRKTITESDNNIFSLLTMNHHPLHLDFDFAKKSQHDQVLVVGTLVFSIVVGLTVADVSGKAIANLGYEVVEHKAPVFIGDTLHAVTKVLSIKPSTKKPDRGVVYVETKAFNQDEIEVLSFKRKVLIPKRP